MDLEHITAKVREALENYTEPDPLAEIPEILEKIEAIKAHYSKKYAEAAQAMADVGEGSDENKKERARRLVNEWRLVSDDLQLHELWVDYLNGKKKALPEAMEICMVASRVMPEWVSDAFLNAREEMTNYYTKSWDEHFGTELEDGQQLNAARKKKELSEIVHWEINLRQRAGVAVENAFIEVGEKFCISASLARKYYYEEKREREALKLSDK